jgi:hypothetical protein
LGNVFLNVDLMLSEASQEKNMQLLWE